MLTPMQILLPPDITQRLADALARAGTREIGGVLMGEHIDENVFRVKNITIQHHGGSFAAFMRMVQDVITPLTEFFRVTNILLRTRR
jgi:[CysO sulfur-carrier protein]-S-L-cysteine hydrolase